MSQPKRGDVVLYQFGGKLYHALVLAAHSLNASHLGKNAEPTLHLSYLPDEPKGKTPQLGSIPEPVTVHDVVHASHEFSQDYLETHGLRKLPAGDPQRIVAEAEIRNRRGAGEWSEAVVLDAKLDEAAAPEGDTQPDHNN